MQLFIFFILGQEQNENILASNNIEFYDWNMSFRGDFFSSSIKWVFVTFLF